MSDVRIVVVGQGLIGTQRAAAVTVLPGASLAATVDPAIAEGRFPGVRHLAALDELDAADYDAAVIAVPHHLARSLVKRVTGSGKPVLVEKPLGITGEAARVLERAAAAVALPSFVGYNYRFLPGVRGVLQATASGRLGRLRSIDMLIGHGGHPDSACGWKLDPARAGGGVLLDPGVHLLDLLLRIAPDLECRGIEATTGFWGTGVEEDVWIGFRGGDVIAALRISHVRWINTFRIEVFGDEGYAIAEGRGGNYGPMSLRIGRRWAWAERKGVPQRKTEEVREFGIRDESLGEELAAVIANWRDGRLPTGNPHPATMAEARRVTELCDELYERVGGRPGA